MTSERQPAPAGGRSAVRSILRRWARLLQFGLIAAAAGGVACLVGREAVLWTLPDVPEPVDATFAAVPAADNAIPAYAAAWRQLQAARDDGGGPTIPLSVRRHWGWASAAEAEAWLAAHPGALDPWLAATRRPDAAPVAGAPETTYLVPQVLQFFALTATIEARRALDAGDPDRAWAYHLGAIRSGLHAMRHAGNHPTILGSNIVQDAAAGAEAWVADPGQTPDRLRRLVADLAACRPIEPTVADLIRGEYLASRKDLADPERWATSQLDPNAPDAWIEHLPGYLRAQQFLRHEPERSLRVLRLITAGQLAQCDRPADERAGLASKEYGIYDVDARTPPAVARVDPARLAAWAEASRCRVPSWNVMPTSGLVFATNRHLDRLRLRAALRAHAHEHDGEPVRTYADLIPAYLDRPPAGATPADPVAPL